MLRAISTEVWPRLRPSLTPSEGVRPGPPPQCVPSTVTPAPCATAGAPHNAIAAATAASARRRTTLDTSARGQDPVLAARWSMSVRTTQPVVLTRYNIGRPTHPASTEV